MRKIALFISICLLSAQTRAQSRMDTVAVNILDRMSQLMGELTSVSATVHTNYDVSNRQLGLVKHSDEEHVYLRGPDKLMLRSEGDKGSRAFYYNGKKLSYYSMDKNQFSEIDAPNSIIDMIDQAHNNYGIFFPIADYLYPSFVDDIIADASDLVYLGTTTVNGKECFHIAGVAKDKTFQFWIANDPFYLPMKLVICYTNKELNPQFEATYCDWQINPSLPDAIFDFTAPHNAKKIKMADVHHKKTTTAVKAKGK